jgi:stage II sporulation protein AA (anti-sigma F factor antagonist)
MPNDALISYRPADADGLVLAALGGDLDLDCADRVRDSLAEAAGRPDCRSLQVDVGELNFIDSYALGALVSARNTAAGAGVVLTLINPSPPVRKALQVTGLADVFGLPAIASSPPGTDSGPPASGSSPPDTDSGQPGSG